MKMKTNIALALLSIASANAAVLVNPTGIT